MLQSTMIDPPLEITTDNCHTVPLDRPITLFAPEGETWTAFTATAVQLILVKGKGNRLQDCHLVLSVALPQYQQILAQALFNLKPEVRGPLQKADFLPDLPLLLELGLKPHFLNPNSDAPNSDAPNLHAPNLDAPNLDAPNLDAPNLDAPNLDAPNLHAPNLDAAEIAADPNGEQAASLLNPLLAILERQTPATAAHDASDDPTLDVLMPLLGNFLTGATDVPEDPAEMAFWQHTDNWLCRSVQQRQGEQTVGYATLWSYTTPEQAEPVMESGTDALEAIASLLQKTAGAVKAEVGQELPQLQDRLSNFSDHLMQALEQVDWETVLTPDEPETEVLPVSEVVKQFFDQDDWAYVQLSDPSILQLAFQGDAGRWTCLAQSHDQYAQVVFYSLCPITVLEAQYGRMSELLMRANEGLIIGNFELNFSSGEIRYKTSLDVENDRLTPALMRQIVCFNVQTMDTYLPSILVVLEGKVSPEAAIAIAEQDEDETPNATESDHELGSA